MLVSRLLDRTGVISRLSHSVRMNWNTNLLSILGPCLKISHNPVSAVKLLTSTGRMGATAFSQIYYLEKLHQV